MTSMNEALQISVCIQLMHSTSSKYQSRRIRKLVCTNHGTVIYSMPNMIYIHLMRNTSRLLRQWSDKIYIDAHTRLLGLLNRGRWKRWAGTHRYWRISSWPPSIPSSPGLAVRSQRSGGCPPSRRTPGWRWPTQTRRQRRSSHACSRSQHRTWLRTSRVPSAVIWPAYSNSISAQIPWPTTIEKEIACPRTRMYKLISQIIIFDVGLVHYPRQYM